MFMTSFTECIAGFLLMLWHATPIAPVALFCVVVLGVMNVTGNLLNANALRHANAAVVEQFHYTQIVTGAFLGFMIWGDVPSMAMMVGAVVIILAGLYVVARLKIDALKLPV